ncbi:hypothetical protein [Nocardiopsis protaetiae]|uniref:hypothetical protein n=1 Tax=Nocardiopsis protaetiae TaxID=3382270 RepID=UPI00387B7810
MAFCERCQEQNYDQKANHDGPCMACQGMMLLADGVPLSSLPPHEVVEEGVNMAGQWYMRVRYADGSLDLIDQ